MLILIKVFAVFSMAIALSGCIVTGPATEKKSILNNLNGENYEKAKVVMGVVVVKRKERDSSIGGQVLLKDGITFVPLKFIPLALQDREGQRLLEANTDSEGKFRFIGVVPNGTYRIELAAKNFTGGQDIEIKDYETSGLTIFAKKKAE